MRFTATLLSFEGRLVSAIAMVLMISNVVFSQTVDNITTGYYTVYQNGRYISQHSNQSKADIKIGMLQEQYPDSNNYYSHPTNTRSIGKLQVTDTLTIAGHWQIWGEYGNWFRLLNGGDFVKIETDSVMSWQSMINVKRVKEFGKVSYEDTKEIPFQFMHIDSVRSTTSNSVTVQTFATKMHGVKYYVDGVLHTDFSDLNIANPGYTEVNGYPVRRHTKLIDGLEPNKRYLLLVEGNSDTGEIDFTQYYIYTDE